MTEQYSLENVDRDLDVLALFGDKEMDFQRPKGIILRMLGQCNNATGRNQMEAVIALCNEQIEDMMVEYPVERDNKVNAMKVSLSFAEREIRRKMLRKSKLTLAPGGCKSLATISLLYETSLAGGGSNKWVSEVYKIVERLCGLADTLRLYHKTKALHQEKLKAQYDARQAKARDAESKQSTAILSSMVPAAAAAAMEEDDSDE